MITVGYDYQIFTLQKYGGISRYFCEISSAIAKNSNYDVTIYAGLYQNKYLANYSNLSITGLQTFNLPIPRRILGFINKRLNKMSFNNDIPDIIHETYYSSKKLAVSKSKTVLTVYDMIHEKFLNNIEHQDFIKTKAEAIARADRIICISESTKADLLQLYDIDSTRISTIHLGFSGLNKPILGIEPIVNCPYILYVGDRDASYKNFSRLVKAYANIDKIKDNFKLICFGLKHFSTDEMKMFAELGINVMNIRSYTGDDSILANLYTYASLLIYPSLYEGFGIPPLEAMSFNCPVACSNVSSIPEVVADAGEYFDPYDVDSISNAIEKVLFSNSRSEEIKQKGRERLEFFSWDKCVREICCVYKSLSTYV